MDTPVGEDEVPGRKGSDAPSVASSDVLNFEADLTEVRSFSMPSPVYPLSNDINRGTSRSSNRFFTFPTVVEPSDIVTTTRMDFTSEQVVAIKWFAFSAALLGSGSSDRSFPGSPLNDVMLDLEQCSPFHASISNPIPDSTLTLDPLETRASLKTPVNQGAMKIDLRCAKDEGVMRTTVVAGRRSVTTEFRETHSSATRLLSTESLQADLQHCWTGAEQVTGPLYDQAVAAYYRHEGVWSDGMGASCDRWRNSMSCCCPPAAFVRLYKTLYRSAPLELHFPCKVLRITGPCSAAAYVAVVLLLLPIFGLGLVLWCFALYSVGRKFMISECQPRCSFIRFFFKTFCCFLCAVNVRVGLHVDRSQGFKEPQRQVTNAIMLAARLQERNGSSMPEGSPSRRRLSEHATGGDMVEAPRMDAGDMVEAPHMHAGPASSSMV
eukprot:TRINITY_DN22016_c0_g1_i2.p1 TRINITY_DN22016_c0_g1~~TRINITY_DN22016_c0_g1_i2.p1  ORF type:complete len:436 (-),score=42.19 TRINITY_DN22016_c0_g1_i2:36-1343(-)